MMMSETISVTGLELMRLLSAFQAMEMTARHNMDRAYGVSNSQACDIVEEMTGIKPQGEGKIEPQKWYKHASNEVLQQYIWWLSGTGEHLDEEEV
jgi:hypothetical protein